MKNFLLVSLVVFLFATKDVYCQSTCALTLRTARATYDQGRLHELPTLLESCLSSGFTKQEKVEAYKLLTLAYIYLEEPSHADNAMLNLLRTDPYFSINATSDPAEFISLYNTFRTWPIYRLGAKVGVNGTWPNIVSYVSAIEGSSSEYTPTINFQSGLSAELPINKSFTLNPELYFQVRSFFYDSDLDLGNDIKNTSTGKESLTWISLPVLLQYNFSTSKFNPYVALGFSADYLINANLTMNRLRVNATSTQERTFDIKGSRNKINISTVAAAGFKLPLGNGFVTGEMRFTYGLTKINNSNSAFTISDYLLFDHAYADNVMRINAVSVTAGYLYNVFNPKKLSRKK